MINSTYFPYFENTRPFIEQYNMVHKSNPINFCITQNGYQTSQSIWNVPVLNISEVLEKITIIDQLIVSKYQWKHGDDIIIDVIISLIEAGIFHDGKLILDDISIALNNALIEKCSKKSIQIELVSQRHEYHELSKREIIQNSLPQPKIPVVYLCEFMRNLDDYKTYYSLLNNFLERNIKVLSFGNHRVNNFINQYTYPREYTDDLSDYVIKINNYINLLIDINHPDIIFINTCDGLLKSRYTSEEIKYWGLNTSLLMGAIMPDIIILIIPFNLNDELVNGLIKYTTEMYKCKTIICHTNKEVDKYISRPNHYLYIDIDDMDLATENINYNNSTLGIQKMANDIIELLKKG